MKTSEKILADVDKGFCIPLKLIMNFSLFQYLTVTYFHRRHETRVRLLILIALTSFASLVPFALAGGIHADNLNDISEVCSVLTFLLQITIVTRDVSKRIKIKSILRLMWCAEVLAVSSAFVLIANFVDLVAPVIDVRIVKLLDSIVLHTALVFIFGFRFRFLAMARGLKKVWKTQKAEIVVYSLFLTHEVPFLLLDHTTHLDWHHVKGLWMRVTIAMCLSLTIRQRMSSKSSKKGVTTMGLGEVGSPPKSQLDRASMHPTLEPAEAPVKQVKVRSPSMTATVAPAPSSRAIKLTQIGWRLR
jgi:hypothetical protein